MQAEPRFVGGFQRTSSYAIASLVLGIAAFVVIPIAGSILAIIFGKKARQDMRDDPGLTGDTLATAGIVLGWVGLGLVIFVFLLFLLLLSA
jgi:hypothetical protein